MNRDLFKKICKIGTLEELLNLANTYNIEFSDIYQRDIYNTLESKKIIIFGAGIFGRKILNVLRDKGLEPEFFCDNSRSKWGTNIMGKYVLPPDYIKNDINNSIVLIAITNNDPIRQQLEADGINYLFCDIDGTVGKSPAPNLFYNIPKLLEVDNMLMDSSSRNVLLNILKSRLFPGIAFEMCGNIFYHTIVSGSQYFDQHYFKYGNNEIYVDCGPFDGDSITEFYKLVYENDLKEPCIYAFEPDTINYQKVVSTINKYGFENIRLFNYGVGYKEQDILLSEIQNCRDEAKTDETIHICMLDNVLKNIPVTFIKMDVEGFELDALKGASELIKINKPKLAISIYHYNEDLYKIPLFIKSLEPQYNIFFRHHSYNTHWETVCYAYII